MPGACTKVYDHALSLGLIYGVATKKVFSHKAPSCTVLVVVIISEKTLAVLMKRTRWRYSTSFLLIQLTFAWTFWFLEVRGNLPRQVWHSGAPSIQYSTYVLPVGGSRNKEPCRIASKRGSSPGPSTQKRCSYIGSEDEDGHTIRIDSNGQIPASWKSGPAASLQPLWKHGEIGRWLHQVCRRIDA